MKRTRLRLSGLIPFATYADKEAHPMLFVKGQRYGTELILEFVLDLAA